MRNPRRGALGLMAAALPLFVGCGPAASGKPAARPHSPRPHATTKTSASEKPRTSGGPPPMPAGLLSAAGQPTSVAVGKHGAAVVFVNPASPLSAYDVHWILDPHLPTGFSLTVVLALPATAVATPGPHTPAFSGKAGTPAQAQTPGVMGLLAPTVRQMWQLPSGTVVDTVRPATLQAWHVTGFPTLWIISAQDQVVAQLPGVLSAGATQTVFQRASGS